MRTYQNVLFSTGLFMALFFAFSCNSTPQKQNAPQTRWSAEKSWEWSKSQGWLTGANFITSTAVNQLECWQAGTFDPETIDRELSWAEDLGFNCMRVFLHHLAWETDREGFKERVDQYLTIADKHGIKTIFVFFDDCWNATYEAGSQPGPEPGVHNSGWVRDPGDLLYSDPGLIKVLEEYVKDILSSFREDRRIVMWDLYNEPGNSGYENRSLPLLEKVFSWAREINPSQPFTAGIWLNSLTAINAFLLENADVITYHNYGSAEIHKQAIDTLKLLNRPLVCTEYMARTINSTFQTILPLLKEHHTGAINWGLVAGKTNTIYAWDTPVPDGSEPELWFTDIFRKDGTPYKQEEVDFIRKMTEVQ